MAVTSCDAWVGLVEDDDDQMAVTESALARYKEAFQAPLSGAHGDDDLVAVDRDVVLHPPAGRGRHAVDSYVYIPWLRPLIPTVVPPLKFFLEVPPLKLLIWNVQGSTTSLYW